MLRKHWQKRKASRELFRTPVTNFQPIRRYRFFPQRQQNPAMHGFATLRSPKTLLWSAVAGHYAFGPSSACRLDTPGRLQSTQAGVLLPLSRRRAGKLREDV